MATTANANNDVTDSDHEALAQALGLTGSATAAIRANIERTLTEWARDGFLFPNWQIVWRQEDGCLHVLFQMVYEKVPSDLSARDFELYAQGFADRRRAVMARQPQVEHPPRPRS